MAVRKIKSRWYVDFRFQHADGRVERVRKRSPINSKAGAEEYERQLRGSMLMPASQPKEVPKFSAFAAEFMKTYAAANNKPSEQAAKASILKHHLLPAFGELRCDEIRMHSIETMKADKLTSGLGRKRVNNILACLGKILRYAHEIEVIVSVPKIKLLKLPPSKFDFLTFEELERFLEVVKADVERRLLFLLGAEAGLRMSEMMALEWGDIDLVAGKLTVRRCAWNGIVGSPKGGRERTLPLTDRLASALRSHRHLRSELVFCRSDGSMWTKTMVDAAVRYGYKRSGLRRISSHVLRHTFCSHLAMRGAQPKAIQELAGHATIAMTMRYMHLAPMVLRQAIELLNPAPRETPGSLPKFGQPVGNAGQVAS
jgi:integrase